MIYVTGNDWAGISDSPLTLRTYEAKFHMKTALESPKEYLKSL